MLRRFHTFLIFPDLYFRPSDSSEKRAERAQINEQIDEKYGFYRHKDPMERVGWLINMHPVSCFFSVLPFGEFCHFGSFTRFAFVISNSYPTELLICGLFFGRPLPF